MALQLRKKNPFFVIRRYPKLDGGTLSKMEVLSTFYIDLNIETHISIVWSLDL